MIISVEKNELLESVLPATGFASGKNTIAATEGILFTTVGSDKCEICAYDLEKGMKTELSCNVIEDGCCIINALRFIQIVRAMPSGELTVEVDEKTYRAKILSGKAQFELQALSGKDFPDLPMLSSDKGFTIKQEDFRNILQKTQFAIAVNNTRPELNGLNIAVQNGVFTAVSCDGSRLALYKENSLAKNIGKDLLDFNIIIPGRTVSELIKFISDNDEEMTINVARKHIIFFVGRFIIFTRLIDAKYIDYDRFIQKNPKIFVETDTYEFASALERSMLITEEKQQGQIKSPVLCELCDGILTVSSSSITGRVNDEIEVKQEGENILIGFNCRYLYDAIKVCDCEKIKISMTSALMGITVEPAEKEENKQFLLLVLPVRLNK